MGALKTEIYRSLQKGILKLESAMIFNQRTLLFSYLFLNYCDLQIYIYNSIDIDAKIKRKNQFSQIRILHFKK